MAVEEALTETDQYVELAKLGVKVEILKSWNPSQEQLETLLAGLRRFYGKQNWYIYTKKARYEL